MKRIQAAGPDRVASLVIRPTLLMRNIRGNHFIAKAVNLPCQPMVTTGPLFGSAARDAWTTWSAVCMGKRPGGR